MGSALAGVLGAIVTAAGLAWGRGAPKRDPVGTVCGTCDGPSRILWDVVPGVGPRACPECGRSVRLPTLMIASAAVASMAALGTANDGVWVMVANGILGAALAGLVWTDARYRLLPARIVWPATAASLAAFVLAEATGSGESHLVGAVLVSLGCGAVFLALHIISPSGMAFGDIRLAVLLGLHLGWRTAEVAVWSFFVAAALAAAVGLVWKQVRGVTTLPFGPFLAAGAALVLSVNALAVE